VYLKGISRSRPRLKASPGSFEAAAFIFKHAPTASVRKAARARDILFNPLIGSFTG
jgi:hypothetical protein